MVKVYFFIHLIRLVTATHKQWFNMHSENIFLCKLVWGCNSLSHLSYVFQESDSSHLGFSSEGVVSSNTREEEERNSLHFS